MNTIQPLPSAETIWDQVFTLLTQRGGDPTPEAFRSAVTTQLDVRTADELRTLRDSDLVGCGVKLPLARALVEIFRATPKSKASTMTLAQLRAIPYQDAASLVTMFDSAVPFSMVGRQINRLARGAPTLVFRTDGTIDLERTTTVLQDLIEGEEPRDRVLGANGLQRIYAIGEGPGQYRVLHPLDGSQLRFDGTGVGDELPWGKLGDDVRAVIIIAVGETHEVVAHRLQNDRMALMSFFSAIKQGGLETVAMLAPRAFLLYSERVAIGGLPPLRALRTNRQRTKRVGRGDPARGAADVGTILDRFGSLVTVPAGLWKAARQRDANSLAFHPSPLSSRPAVANTFR